MQEQKNKVRSKTEEMSGNSVSLLVQSRLVQLTGNWYWDLYADAVFCSDVILSAPLEFAGTKTLLHPDDKTHLLAQVSEHNAWAELQFRVITTYGEVKTLVGYNIQKIEDDAENEKMRQQLFHAALPVLNNHTLHIVKEALRQTERNTQIGTWFHNKATHQTWYSAQVFRIYDLPPNSLNAHLNTFSALLHPEDRETILEFVDKSYRQEVPLHLDFRIVTPMAVKHVRQMMQWTYTPQGAPLWCVSLQDITEQILAESRASEITHEALFHKQLLVLDEQHAGIGHWHLNLLTRSMQCSNHLYRLFGLKAQNATTGIKAFINYIHPEDQEPYEKALRQMIGQHQPPDIEFRIIRTDGKVRHLSQKAKLLHYGEELVMAGMVQDVTLQKSLEKKIQHLNQATTIQTQVQQLAGDMSGIGTWTWNLKTGKEQCSESFFKLLGLKQQEAALTQKQLLTFIHFEDQKKFTDTLAYIVQQRQEKGIHFRLLQRGKVRQVKAFFRFLNETENDLLISIWQDITPEAELEQQLQQQKQLAWAMAENIPDQILITDADNRILLWNHQCEKEYKIKSSEAVGKNYFDVLPHLKTTEEIQLLHRVLEGETILNWERQSTKELKHLELQLMPLWSDDHNEVTGILHIVRDQTRERELRRHLNERLLFIESLVEASVDKIIALDRNMNYLLWNKPCEQYYGIPKEQIIGKNILEVFPDMRNLPAYEDFRKALRGQTVYLPANKDEDPGNYHETYLIPVTNEKKEIIAVLWIQHDLSKELELHAHQHKIAKLIEALDEGYFELDSQLTIISVNHVAARFWNKTADALLGKKFTDIFPQVIGSTIYNTLLECFKEKKTITRRIYFTDQRQLDTCFLCTH